jgi:hypothetical protein
MLSQGMLCKRSLYPILMRMRLVKIVDLVRQNQDAIFNNINQCNVHRLWFDLDYGGCCFGIFSDTTPVEPLHALDNGLITDCVHILFGEEMTTKQKQVLDFSCLPFD